MADTICGFYYDQIKKPNSIEQDVDNFWNNTLPIYFRRDLSYGIEQGQRELPGINNNDPAASMIRCVVKTGTPEKIVILVEKYRGTETNAAQWKHALDQLTMYLSCVRAEQETRTTCYGAVAIGSYIWFYKLDAEESKLEAFNQQTSPFELKRDEETVHNVLTQWVALTSH